MKNLTLKRETEEIFTVIGTFPYWSDGSAINARVAFDGDKLSAIAAQSIDRRNGMQYLLISPISFKRASMIDAARRLAVGETEQIC